MARIWTLAATWIGVLLLYCVLELSVGAVGEFVLRGLDFTRTPVADRRKIIEVDRNQQ